MPAIPPLLVVEDDNIVRMLLVDVLNELGYEVTEAQDGEEALKLIEDPQQPFSLMLTDVGLPGMNGHDLARLTRELRPLLPILFASGYGSTMDVPEGMHVIGKPFTIDQLRDKMKGILG